MVIALMMVTFFDCGARERVSCCDHSAAARDFKAGRRQAAAKVAPMAVNASHSAIACGLDRRRA
jgi:hypothetical protein